MEQIKWSKSGRRFTKNKIFNKWIDSGQIDSISAFMTPSLREVLRIFGENIVELKARGAKQISKTSPLKYEEIGTKFITIQDNMCLINYDWSYSKVLKHMPLDKREINKILNGLDKYGIGDCAVEHLVIKFQDSKLRKIIEGYYETKVDSDIFYATLKLGVINAEIESI